MADPALDRHPQDRWSAPRQWSLAHLLRTTDAPTAFVIGIARPGVIGDG